MFDSNQLAFMRSVQDGHMQDTCYRMAYSRTFNEVNEPVESWTQADDPTICGLEMKSGSEVDKKTMTLVNYDAVLRLPVDTVTDPKDRWKITRQYGEDISPIVYEAVSPIQRGPSGIRILLRKVNV